VQALLEVGKTLRQRGKTLFAGIPIAGRQIEQRLRQTVGAQALADLFAVKPAFAAASKRSRNGTSLNIMVRLAAKRGIAVPFFFENSYFGSPGSFVPVTRA
jgi:hypothetical protein